MLRHKSKIWLYSIFIGWTTVVLGGACSPNPSINSAMGRYTPPASPGPVTITDGTVKVEPKLIEANIQNPGIGWQKAAETSSALAMPESVVYANRREIAWSVLNPSEGVYEWSILNRMLEEAAAQSQQFSFRVYTMVGEDLAGAMVPGWVLAKGATLIPSTGEPDYSNCVYQEEWGKFVSAMAKIYDGNPNIAFIDISGYGNFNEWSWQDSQTEWDMAWATGYADGSVSPVMFETLDGQARRRLSDMFIGGSFDAHQCRLSNRQIQTVGYSYEGFQKTQLVMPYAGIVQSSQYVFSRRSDVGFRYDCLGRSGGRVLEKVGDVLSKIWATAPVVFEFCKSDQFDVDDARMLLQAGHGSIVHDNNWRYSARLLKDLLQEVGYRYFLRDATLNVKDRAITLQMNWLNVGLAPSYPKMGQEFQLYFYLIDSRGKTIYQEPVSANISQWLPADLAGNSPPVYEIFHSVQLPFLLTKGTYYTGVAIIDERTGKPINLAIDGQDPAGWTMLAPLQIR